MSRFSRFFLRKRRYDDLAVSIQEHIDERADELVDEGMARDVAERAARREFGNVTLLRERSREVWQWRTLESIWADVRYAVRQLRKSPGFAITAILTLAIAVGANTAVFSLMDALLLRSLPVHDPRQLVIFKFDLGRTSSDGFFNSGYSGYEFSYPLSERFRKQDKLFEDVFGYASLGFQEKNVVLRTGNATLEATGTMVTGGFFDGLGVAARVGRTIVDSDLSASAPHVAVISYTFWQRAFAGSPGVVGQSITLNSIPYTIVGVAARGFSGVQTGIADEVWIPITRTATLAPWGVSSIDESPMTSERWWWLTVMGRLRPGVSREQAAAGAGTALVSTIANLNSQAEKEEPGKGETAKNELAPSGKLPFIKFEDGSRGMPFMEEEYSEPITLLMGLVGLVLLAACANLATLLLARASARSREIAVRLALGASPVRVWRQMLTESLLLSFSGGLLGVAAAPLAMRAIAAGLTRRGSNGLSQGLALDHRVLLFTAGLSVLTGLCFGIAPAVRSGRIDVNSSLKDGAATDSGRSRLPMRWLVVAQAAISTVLLIVSGIFLHSLTELRRQATGFDEKHLLVFSLQPSQSGYNDGQLPALYAEIRERLAALPSVTSATTLGNRLISGWQSNFEVQIEGYKAPDNQDPNVISNTVGAGFLRTAGIPLLMGRDFGESDTIASPKVAIVNEAFAKKYFAAANALGRHLQFKPWDAGKVVDKPVSYTIVGICGDARYTSMRDEMKPTWYEAMGQQDGSHLKNVHFMLRSRGDPTAVTASVLAALRGVGPGLVASDIKTEAEQIDDSISSDRMFAQLSTFFGGLALLLAAIGLYGTLAYSVARRQRELGIRLALGAERRKVVGLVLSQGLRLVAAGIVAGWILSALAGKMLAHLTESVLFHVTMLDAVSFVGAALVLAFLAAVTAFVPARRAANTDPIEVLRAE